MQAVPSLPGKVLHGLSLWWEKVWKKLRGDKDFTVLWLSSLCIFPLNCAARSDFKQGHQLPGQASPHTELGVSLVLGGIWVSGCSSEMQTLPGLLLLLQEWGHSAQLCCGGARAVPEALAELPGIYTRAQRQPQHHGSAPRPWLSVKPQNAPVKTLSQHTLGQQVALCCCFSPWVVLKSIIVHILLFQSALQVSQPVHVPYNAAFLPAVVLV